MIQCSLPKISIVIPSYNQAAYLEETLKSVFCQNYPNTEVLVLDGGSKDGSIQIIEKYAPKLAYWVSKPDGGQTPALIDGFQRTTGDIQCWLNSDDLLTPGSLRVIGEAFRNRPDVDVVFGDAIWMDASGRHLRVQKEIPFNRFLWFHTYNYIPGMSTFWRKSLYERVGGLDPTFNLAMDADLWIRFSDAKAKFLHVKEILSKTRFHPEQKTRKLNQQSQSEIQKIYFRYHPRSRAEILSLKRFLARSLRIAWRTTTGCYQRGYNPDMEKLEAQSP